MTLLKQTQSFFLHILLSSSQKFWVLLSFGWLFVDISLVLLLKGLLMKKNRVFGNLVYKFVNKLLCLPNLYLSIIILFNIFVALKRETPESLLELKDLEM